MKLNHCPPIYCLMWVFILFSCNGNTFNDTGNTLSEDFKNYWYAGKAEVNSYNLVQSRYGEERAGKAMLIYVTEDFSKAKHVKLDDPDAGRADKVSVLKLNMTKNFVTGIYPYSMMLSAFTPVDVNQMPHTLKLTMSSQEWCGQVYSQVNLMHQNYKISNYSYFEKEGDEELNVKVAWLEDELWNRIRLNPSSLPMGEVDMLPGLFFSRLNHMGLKIEKAVCSKAEDTDRVVYEVKYPEHDRSLVMEFDKKFPHQINSWTETVRINGKTHTTTATLDKQLITDYWSKNKNEFLNLRDSLGLSHQNY